MSKTSLYLTGATIAPHIYAQRQRSAFHGCTYGYNYRDKMDSSDENETVQPFLKGEVEVENDEVVRTASYFGDAHLLRILLSVLCEEWGAKRKTRLENI